MTGRLSGRLAPNSSHKHYTMSETDIKQQIVDYLQIKGAWTYLVHGHLGARPGVPDLLFCWRGRFGAVETKVPRPQNTVKQRERFLSPAQRAQLLAITRAGGLAIVATRLEDVMAILKGG